MKAVEQRVRNSSEIVATVALLRRTEYKRQKLEL